MGCFGYICKECGTSIRGDCHDGGEKCVLIHVRHGKEIGRVEGHYNEYGTVIEHDNVNEDYRFRGDGENNPNSHKEICHSEMYEKDSYHKLSQFRVYNEDWVDFHLFVNKRFMEELRKSNYDIENFLYNEVVLAKAIVDRKFSDKLNEYYVILKKYRLVDKTDEQREESIRVMEVDANFMCDMIVWDFYDWDDDLIRAEWDNLPRIEMDGYSGIVAYHSSCYKRAMRKKTFNLVPSENDPNQSWGKIRKRFSR